MLFRHKIDRAASMNVFVLLCEKAFCCCCCCLGGMFTANTMSSVVETLGLSLPGAKQQTKS